MGNTRDILGRLSGQNQMVQDLLQALAYAMPLTRNPHGDQLAREVSVVELGRLPPYNYIAQPNYENQNIGAIEWKTIDVPDLFEVTFAGSAGYVCIIDPNLGQDPQGASSIDCPIDGTQFVILHPGESIKFTERRTIRAACVPWFCQYVAGLSIEWNEAHYRWPSAQPLILSAKPINHFLSQIPASSWYLPTGFDNDTRFEQSFTLINWGRVSKFVIGITGGYDESAGQLKDCEVSFHTFHWASTIRWRENQPPFDPWPSFAKPTNQTTLYYGPFVDTEYELEVEPFESVHFDSVVYGTHATANRAIICHAISNHQNALPMV